MVEKHRNGGSTKNLLPLEPSTTINHGTSRALEEPTTCKSGALTQDGGKSSPIKMSTSSIGRIRNALMLLEAKMLKVELLLLGRDTMVLIRDGRSSILTRQKALKPRELMKTSDGMSIDHSTWYPDFQ